MVFKEFVNFKERIKGDFENLISDYGVDCFLYKRPSQSGTRIPKHTFFSKFKALFDYEKRTGSSQDVQEQKHIITTIFDKIENQDKILIGKSLYLVVRIDEVQSGLFQIFTEKIEKNITNEIEI